MNEFDDNAAGVMRSLMVDFDLTPEQAAGIVGNLGAESGLRAVQEARPTVPGSRGGYGWAQWTGPRRRQFEAYCARNGLEPRSYKANYGWLFVELSGPYAHAITQLKKTTTLKAAVETFEANYEKAGIKRMAARVRFAERALALYQTTTGGIESDVKRIQQKLHDLGHGEVVGPVDGTWGPRTEKGVMAALGISG
jgi:hypothetical protein